MNLKLRSRDRLVLSTEWLKYIKTQTVLNNLGLIIDKFKYFENSVQSVQVKVLINTV